MKSKPQALLEADSYYLIVRLDHPRNHALYMYHAANHSVTVIDNAVPTLLLSPTVELWWDRSQSGTEPNYIDDYEVINVGTGTSSPLHVPGTPLAATQP